ncbi:hypothetical protein G9A89_015882 [Geosiphon pyriformis]|nr:hypothetical protein G9A89_015882 [Geosiphon pyriformis]
MAIPHDSATPPSLPPRSSKNNFSLLTSGLKNGDTFNNSSHEMPLDSLTENEVKDAYNVLDAHDFSINDETLIGIYKIRASDNPLDSSRQRNALEIIGKSKRSPMISKFLENEEEYNIGLSNMDFFSQMPVGLNNIGNTCYLNSLLQYYFTIRELRKAVLETEVYEEQKVCQTPIIGGREVSPHEVERAKKFVNLLRTLFVNLIHTSENSISPDFDLAFMALVSTKNDDNEIPSKNQEFKFEGTAFKPSDENIFSHNSNSSKTPKVPLEESKGLYVSTISQSDETISGPSLTNLHDSPASPDINSNSEEEETVEMQGIAGSSSIMIPGSHTSSSQQTEQDLFAPTYGNKQLNPFLVKGKGKENIENLYPIGSDPPPDFKQFVNEDKFKSMASISFGKQQDVTECMDNVMFQLEAALQPRLSEESEVTDGKSNIVKRLFYGKTRQVLQYDDPNTGERGDLYNGLDVYFDEAQVDFNGTQAEREVTLIELPPILQVHVQRVQFDRTTANVYKSNAYIRFDKVIYLDRYLDEYREIRRERRKIANDLNQQIEMYSQQLNEFSPDKVTGLSPDEMLNRTVKFILSQRRTEINDDLQDEINDRDLADISNESCILKSQKEDLKAKIAELQSDIRMQYDDLRKCEYRIHAVFIHSGQANFGHYWIYIYDFEKDRWFRYNDSHVTEVLETEVFADTTGSFANPYCMVYVRANDCKQLVNTVCRKRT